MQGHFPDRHAIVSHEAMMWLADSSLPPHSQVGVDAILHLCIAFLHEKG